MHQLQLTQLGNQIGVVLPPEVLSQFNLVAGDTLVLVESANGFTLTKASNEAKQLQAAQKVLANYKNAFHELAK